MFMVFRFLKVFMMSRTHKVRLWINRYTFNNSRKSRITFETGIVWKGQMLEQVLEKIRQQIPKIRVLSSCILEVWEQSLRGNMDWKFCDMRSMSTQTHKIQMWCWVWWQYLWKTWYLNRKSVFYKMTKHTENVSTTNYDRECLVSPLWVRLGTQFFALFEKKVTS